MVKFTALVVSLLCLNQSWAQTASKSAVVAQTYNDLQKLKDRLQYFQKQNAPLVENLSPALLAPPKAMWQETASVFDAKAREVVSDLFAAPGSLVDCPECRSFRVYSKSSGVLAVDSGMVGAFNFETLRQVPRYAAARSLVSIEETGLGVMMRIVDINSSVIHFQYLADSRKTLEHENSWKNFAQEYHRKARGESLNYVFFNLGLYPTPALQLEFLEQWGDRNQHISGIMVSFLNPEAAFGVAYHYMLPSMRKLSFGAAVMYPLSAVATQSDGSGDAGSGFVLQGSAAYVLGQSMGVYAAVVTRGGVTVGFSFFNSLFMPFVF